jgi:hypothetical protein
LMFFEDGKAAVKKIVQEFKELWANFNGQPFKRAK